MVVVGDNWNYSRPEGKEQTNYIKNWGGSAGSNGNFMSCTPSAEYKDMEMTAF